MAKRWLSDIMQERKLSKNKINLIEAHCGCGKTTWFFEHLLPQYIAKHKVVYLVDTNMLEDSMINEYKHLMQQYGRGWRCEDIMMDFTSNDKVMCMSYKKFGILVKQYPEIIEYLDLIVCDEVHNLSKYTHLKKMEVKKILDVANAEEIDKIMEIGDELTILTKKLMEGAKKGIVEVVMLTATPFHIKKLYKEKYNYDLNVVVKLNELEGYTCKTKVEYMNINNSLSNINLEPNEKAIVYIPYISNIKKYVDLIEQQGYRAIGLWSKNNTKHRMQQEQIDVRDYLIKTEEFPKDYDIIIFNEAYTTGWNLTDKDNVVQHCLCHSNELDVQTQFKGRIRHDIKYFYIPTKEISNEEIILDDKWLNIVLTSEDRKILCEEIGMLDKNGKLLKWSRISKKLIQQGYSITSSKPMIDGSRKNCEMITKSE